VIRGYHYDLVKVQGEPRIRNRLAEEVSVEITKELPGEVLDKGPNATDTKTAEGLKKVSPKHTPNPTPSCAARLICPSLNLACIKGFEGNVLTT
jgi:hypothetical protein